MKRLAPFKEDLFVFEELKPKVKYATILQPETDWEEEKIFSSNINGIPHEHRDHG